MRQCLFSFIQYNYNVKYFRNVKILFDPSSDNILSLPRYICREFFFPNMLHIVSFSHLSSKTRKSEAPEKEQVNMKPIIKPGDFDLKKKIVLFH